MYYFKKFILKTSMEQVSNIKILALLKVSFIKRWFYRKLVLWKVCLMKKVIFVLYSFQQTAPSNLLLGNFESFGLSFAYNFTTGTYNCLSLIAKIIFLDFSLLTLWLPTANNNISSI